MGAMLHYFLLVAYMWMLIEGFQLYRMVKNAFDGWTTKLTIFYVLVAYTVPLLIVIVVLTAGDSDGSYYGPTVYCQGYDHYTSSLYHLHKLINNKYII